MKIKKIISLLLTSLILLSLISCNTKNNSNPISTQALKNKQSTSESNTYNQSQTNEYFDEKEYNQKLINKAKSIAPNSSVIISTERYNLSSSGEKTNQYTTKYMGIIFRTGYEFATGRNIAMIVAPYSSAIQYDSSENHRYNISDYSKETYTATLLSKSKEYNLAIFSYDYKPSPQISPIIISEKAPEIDDTLTYINYKYEYKIAKCTKYYTSIWDYKTGLKNNALEATINQKGTTDQFGMLLNALGELEGICYNEGYDITGKDNHIWAVTGETIITYLKLLGYK